ncbi:MAG TPA: cytochrome C oxidase subunit IV family protein [Thermomicrobiales bacterium]|jgi:cytochrome c oxidase subunit 4|nr:cytochrome C oxidase subunit IV [Chloroflexota bacterium]HQX63567.1 cytochrome C oxidase subunit IV family protein [Thermomicrobiales bacterium]HBY45888.1 cytochrome C oxidase subunit IV [Chloroflexota bacterium]HCG30816.1 cytochrome C oxidase subunit IV [Chloroflexota bacterium]HQZ89422.1 cytochrome C oxidase subunit IV family protein [Thermomicrobiales bacterium]
MSSVPQEQAGSPAHEHPTWQTYAKIAAILTIITALEVATYYLDIGSMLVYVLLVLSALKFGIVIGYYMHLKFDNRLYTFIFGAGLAAAISILVALLALFDRLG